MSSDDFNPQARPVMCVFFPYKEAFKQRLEMVMDDDAAVHDLLRSVIEDFGSFLVHMKAQGGVMAAPALTEDGLFIDCSADVFSVSKEAVFDDLDPPRLATEEETAEYREDNDLRDAVQPVGDDGPKGNPPQIH